MRTLFGLWMVACSLYPHMTKEKERDREREEGRGGEGGRGRETERESTRASEHAQANGQAHSGLSSFSFKDTNTIVGVPLS